MSLADVGWKISSEACSQIGRNQSFLLVVCSICAGLITPIAITIRLDIFRILL